MPPVVGRRAAPLDLSLLDLRTVAELARVLDERLKTVAAFGSCPTCREAEAKAFLAQLRRVLQADGQR